METETGSKKVRQGDLKSEGHPSNTELATDLTDMLPLEMMQFVYKFLPFKDLLVCRQVSKNWKSEVTDPVRKRCAPLAFSRDDIPASERGWAILSFTLLIRATNQDEGFNEFPVTGFILDLNSDYYWIEMDGSTLISQFLEAVSPFVRHIVFDFQEKNLPVTSNCLTMPQALSFQTLTKITFEVLLDEKKDSEIFSFVRNVIEKSPNLKEFGILLHVSDEARRGATRRFIVETGIEQKAGLVTSFSITAPEKESDLEYVNKLGFKLKHFCPSLMSYNRNTGIFKKFLEIQSDTLASLHLYYGNSYKCLRELPCLPHLKKFEIASMQNKEEVQLPPLVYKEQLPDLKELNLTRAPYAANYFIASHLAPSESLRELILPNRGMEEAGEVIRQAARLFPNLKTLKVYHEDAGHYMSDIYDALQGIEELCILTNGPVNLDKIITGLPERLLHKLKNGVRPRYHMSKALAMLERGTTKTLACLDNLKILVIKRVASEDVGEVDFTELSGTVLKQMKTLQHIDFGIRKYGPILSATLKEDLESRGIKLYYQKPRYIRTRTNFIESLIESDSD